MAFRVRIIDTEYGRHEYMVENDDNILVSRNCDGRFEPIQPEEPDLATVIEAITDNGWDANDLQIEEKELDDFGVDDMYEHIIDNSYRRNAFFKMLEEAGYKVSKED